MNVKVINILGISMTLLAANMATAAEVSVEPQVTFEEAKPTSPTSPKPPKPPKPPKSITQKILLLQGKGLFAHNSDLLGPTSQQMLFEMIGNLEKLQNIQSLHVVGHTDSTGSEKLNDRLSLLRAKMVQAFLQGAYPEVTVTVTGMGETSPIHPNSTPEGRQMNRRVEIRVSTAR